MKNFKELDVWKFAFEISKAVFRMVDTFSKEDQWTIGKQMIRAAISIPSNIAEGSSRSSEKEYNRFIEISLGSAFELETQLLIAKSTGRCNQELVDNTMTLLLRVQKMLNSFSKTLQGRRQ